jgi:hypothetical protein
MILSRRTFLSLLLWQPAQTTSIPVKVLETFSRGQAPLAILVHHADEATRDTFARWLQTHPRSEIRVRNSSGDETDATIFRVRMCFGRGLILFNRPLRAGEGEILSIRG